VIDRFVDIGGTVQHQCLAFFSEYASPFVTFTLCDGNLSHDNDHKTFKVMTSTWPLGTIDSVASLLVATFYQEND
jgi:hypothetical protein